MAETRQRIDKFLWCMRAVKTRLLAVALVERGGVRINHRKVTKPGHAVALGDVVTFAVGAQVRAVRVVAIAPRRGQSSEALALYEELHASHDAPQKHAAND